MKSVLRICRNTEFVAYYESLTPNIVKRNIKEREQKIINATTPMLQYYCLLIDAKKKSSIYGSYIDDRSRYIITRWRLSNHKLFIETGRYKNPKVPRQDRKCISCDILEDEHHAIYMCPSFAYIRQNHEQLLAKYPTVRHILDPNPPDIYAVAKLLGDIDRILEKR